MKVSEAMDKIAELEKQKKKYQQALRALRGQDELENIERDPRDTVKTIYALWLQKDKAVAELLNRDLSEPEEENPLLSE
jgi:hypothetical protein